MEAEVCPLYKTDGRAHTSNYHPISILSNVSKMYERYLYKQLHQGLFPKLREASAFFQKGTFSMNVYSKVIVI